MKSFVSTTFELVDMEAAARELVEGLRLDALEANRIGFLFCDSELEEMEILLGALERALGFELVGCTTQATINPAEGISEMSTVLLVLSADDCRFRAGVSEPIAGEDDCRERIETLYRELRASLDAQPALLITFPPRNYEIMIDRYPELLGELSGGLPVFGGLPGCNAPYGIQASVWKGKLWTDRLLLVMAEGNLRPLFSSEVELSHLEPNERTITESRGNVCHSIDGLTVPQYLESVGLDPVELSTDETDMMYMSNPLLLTRKDLPMEEYRLVRTFHALDLRQGTGTSVGAMPEGHAVRLGMLSRRDVETSARRSIEKLLEQIEAAERARPDYRYSTVIVVSCSARYMVATPLPESTTNLFHELLPERLRFAGYYAYSEFVPTGVQGDGAAINTAQNESMTLCAF